mmetsp:Transcript_34993/g.69073  ORF Transcript_34993/g.69073 Transcript_34993/m.69073 type:complete len:229 (-) Transcript_34993:349-1035(-)
MTMPRQPRRRLQIDARDRFSQDLISFLKEGTPFFEGLLSRPTWNTANMDEQREGGALFSSCTLSSRLLPIAEAPPSRQFPLIFSGLFLSACSVTSCELVSLWSRSVCVALRAVGAVRVRLLQGRRGGVKDVPPDGHSHVCMEEIVAVCHLLAVKVARSEENRHLSVSRNTDGISKISNSKVYHMTLSCLFVVTPSVSLINSYALNLKFVSVEVEGVLLLPRIDDFPLD